MLRSESNVLVDTRNGRSLQTLICHSVSEVVLMALSERSAVKVDTDITSSTTTYAYMLEYRTGLMSCILSSSVLGLSQTSPAVPQLMHTCYGA